VTERAIGPASETYSPELAAYYANPRPQRGDPRYWDRYDIEPTLARLDGVSRAVLRTQYTIGDLGITHAESVEAHRRFRLAHGKYLKADLAAQWLDRLPRDWPTTPTLVVQYTTGIDPEDDYE
jgi:hypothetical protein